MPTLLGLLLPIIMSCNLPAIAYCEVEILFSSFLTLVSNLTYFFCSLDSSLFPLASFALQLLLVQPVPSIIWFELNYNIDN